jgi:SAM-dependent methyltransferase
VNKAQDEQTYSERRGTDLITKDSSAQDHLSARTLSNTCPVLGGFLKPGMRVLDVGCSSGSITLSVANAVGEGRVVGVDTGEEAVAKASADAEKMGISNAEFHACDAYSLDFEDNSFDLVYSNALFEWLRNPIAALEEQARVTHDGGWVVAMVASWQYVAIYPDCPGLRRLYSAGFDALADPPEGLPFFNNHAPHEAFGWLMQAEFRDHQLTGFTPDIDIAYRGSEYFEFRHDTFQMQSRLFSSLCSKTDQAQMNKEIETWHNHPHAFFMQPRLAACGRVF